VREENRREAGSGGHAGRKMAGRGGKLSASGPAQRHAGGPIDQCFKAGMPRRRQKSLKNLHGDL
jgi:hypothetical protein